MNTDEIPTPSSFDPSSFDPSAPKYPISEWKPMSRPGDLAIMGKLSEELGELISATQRCIIQGIDEVEPRTGKPNCVWLEEEIADVEMMLAHIKTHFNLNGPAIHERKWKKYFYKKPWFDWLNSF